jgi:hypothetical protein
MERQIRDVITHIKNLVSNSTDNEVRLRPVSKISTFTSIDELGCRLTIFCMAGLEVSDAASVTLFLATCNVQAK